VKIFDFQFLIKFDFRLDEFLVLIRKGSSGHFRILWWIFGIPLCPFWNFWLRNLIMNILFSLFFFNKFLLLFISLYFMTFLFWLMNLLGKMGIFLGGEITGWTFWWALFFICAFHGPNFFFLSLSRAPHRDPLVFINRLKPRSRERDIKIQNFEKKIDTFWKQILIFFVKFRN
jgi:hypothetical protein